MQLELLPPPEIQKPRNGLALPRNEPTVWESAASFCRVDLNGIEIVTDRRIIERDLLDRLNVLDAEDNAVQVTCYGEIDSVDAAAIQPELVRSLFSGGLGTRHAQSPIHYFRQSP